LSNRLLDDMPSDVKNFLQDAGEITDFEINECIDSVKLSVIIKQYLYYIVILICSLMKKEIE